jgi:hypothetical protein
MGAGSNIAAKFKQLFYNAGANSTVVSDASDSILRKEVQLAFDSATTTTSVNYKVEGDLKLVEAFFSSTVATASAAANTVFFTVTTNGVEVANVNTDGDSLNTVAVGGYYDLDVNTANSYVDDGEYVVCAITHQEGGAAGGIFTLRFEPN